MVHPFSPSIIQSILCINLKADLWCKDYFYQFVFKELLFQQNIKIYVLSLESLTLYSFASCNSAIINSILKNILFY